jgi:hypothetical protein
MSSSSFTCVNTSDLEKVAKAAAAYQKMSQLSVVVSAAKKAGQYFSQSVMSPLIKGESSLSDYHHVADALHSYEVDEPHNVHAGLYESHPHIQDAHKMEEIYPVNQVAMDLSRQQGDTEAKFFDALAEAVSR